MAGHIAFLFQADPLITAHDARILQLSDLRRHIDGRRQNKYSRAVRPHVTADSSASSSLHYLQRDAVWTLTAHPNSHTDAAASDDSASASRSCTT